MIDRPIGKNGASINELAGNGAKDARVIGADAVVAHDEIAVLGDAEWAVVAHIFVLRRDVRLVDGAAVKYAPVFQSESGGSVLNFGQCVLQEWS